MKRILAVSALAVDLAAAISAFALPADVGFAWVSPDHYRILLSIAPKDVKRSNSPALVDLDFPNALAALGGVGAFDPDTIEVVAYGASGKPVVIDAARPESERHLLPWYLEKFYGIKRATLHFVVPDETCTRCAVYFDTLESRLGKPQRPRGMVGDGDRFTEGYERREINACHFDCFCDFDRDGDLDLIKGGIEPFLYYYENVGRSHFIDRGRLTSAGKPLTFPVGKRNNRGWVTSEFNDWDGDGDQDLFASFSDGPSVGEIILYENTTAEGGLLTFMDRGPLRPRSGKPLGSAWFAAVTVADWDGDGKKDVLVARNNSLEFFRNIGPDSSIQHIRLSDGVPVLADGKKIDLPTPRFDCADIDGDGDLDLFAGTQNGPIHLFTNTGTRTNPVFDAGRVVAFERRYMIGDAHAGVKVADFDGDGLLDFVVGRYWERTPVETPLRPRDYGGMYRNVGTKTQPKFEYRDAQHGAPYTEQFQICDAVRQNGVRAVDWDHDGRLDLLAGDTDGFIWFFRNQTDVRCPVFATGEKLWANGAPLSVGGSGGHARFDVCDWNGDGRLDLVVADGGGTVTAFVNEGSQDKPVLMAGRKLDAEGKPIKQDARASALVCDWDNDGSKDLVVADSKSYYLYRNMGTGAEPVLAAGKPITFNRKPPGYVRPNLGSFVDWDGDGRKDFIGCNFENSILLYMNAGSGSPRSEPEFASMDGVTIVQPWTSQMISGADAVDWNGDGDLDILTGQGHGGSGLRFYERDYINDVLNKTQPVVTAGKPERKP